MAEEIEAIRTAYISFLECEVRGFWMEDEDPGMVNNELPSQQVWKIYSAATKGSEISLVRPDGLRRMFRFKKHAEVAIGQQMVRFEQEDVLEELSVDDEKNNKK
jgi:hypothetical protein